MSLLKKTITDIFLLSVFKSRYCH